MDPACLDLLRQVPATPEETMWQTEAQAAIARSLASLTPREERVLRMYFGLDDTPAQVLRQIAERFAVSASRVSAIREGGLRKLRHPARYRRLLDAAETLGVDVTRLRLAAIRYERRVEKPQLRPSYRVRDVGRRPPPKEPLPVKERPPLIPARQVYPDWVALLRLAPEARNEMQRIALAHHLEDVFCSRGAGDLIIRQMPTWRQTQLRKYNYIMENLHWLWERFPPAPDLAAA
jgi:RNA polymerase primary sigma factor